MGASDPSLRREGWEDEFESKGKARHQKVRSAVGHAKLKRNDTLEALREMQPEARRRYLALGRLMRAQRIQREGRHRAEIASNVAAGLQEHREMLVAKAEAQEADRVAKLAKYSTATRLTRMQDVHHLNIEQIKEQMWIRKVVDRRRIDNKELTVGGSRVELLGRLKSVMLLEDEHAADGYDIDAAKNFYMNGSSKHPASDTPASDADELPPPLFTVERIETAEERDGEMHYLLKWAGRDETHNTWAAQSALPDLQTLELVAAFEESQAKEESPVDEEETLADDEFLC